MIEIIALISVILFLVVLLFTPILPPRQNYEGWTDFQVQQAEAARGREVSSIRNRVLEERYNG